MLKQILTLVLTVLATPALSANDYLVVENDEQLLISTPELEAAFSKKGYVTGIKRQTFYDKQTGFRDAGFGLDIVDWIMEPGSDKAYRDQLDSEMIYRFGNSYHGKTPKRMIEGPQICTRARQMDPQLLQGEGFIAVQQKFTYHKAAPGKKTGSRWMQWIVFPKGKRYFVSMDQINTVNSSNAMFLRIDMPGHIRHNNADTFSEIYLSYLEQSNSAGQYENGIVPASAFSENFAPDERFNYRRDNTDKKPDRFIRAYHLRDPKTGKDGPWLAGMTLDPSIVHEAWCHQRNYVCMIQEIGGKPVKAGDSFRAAFLVGFFDSIEEMHEVYDAHRDQTKLLVSKTGWKLQK